MKLYVLRHGEAEARAHNDSTRELTARGRLEIEQVARLFAARHIKLQRCFVSPYTRAAQTAALFLPLAAQSIAAETTPLLMPEVRASYRVARLARQCGYVRRAGPFAALIASDRNRYAGPWPFLLPPT